MQKRLTEIIRGERPSLSFEVFPPKKSSDFETVRQATEQIAALHPSYMSVTYGAGGGTSDYTLAVAQNLESRFGVPALAHLSCVSSTRSGIRTRLDALRTSGLRNILALRGDMPENPDAAELEFHYAAELVEEIKRCGDFCIGGACYPEGHPESATCEEDLRHLREKVECGCEFLVTQMFFDNNILYNFLYRALRAGIDVPVVAGIMPVTSAKQIKRICAISGTALPQRFRRIVDRYGGSPAAMFQAGVAYATEQIIDLFANGIDAVHVYSMNRPDVAAAIRNNLSSIL